MIFFCEKTFNENLYDNKIISLKIIHLQIIFICIKIISRFSWYIYIENYDNNRIYIIWKTLDLLLKTR